ncbi:hypothetical protein GGTG_00704 [Gaeumannomyces tritici R3-111a-1]|uniref:Uncharacterized protein n=1 Tax=Gaeumannomyces tritici (strain R3-111a-1) TaxID=644352 RepID=J3NHG7_GAET3|nr:hypothetical protein GGTG_00704 [Gaeumannomyces tritici R3-111a-1]EJT80710.1 hypothetical protein GGTG_00704 [Gaeumannomyces tritici R3-111a-1]
MFETIMPRGVAKEEMPRGRREKEAETIEVLSLASLAPLHRSRAMCWPSESTQGASENMADDGMHSLGTAGLREGPRWGKAATSVTPPPPGLGLGVVSAARSGGVQLQVSWRLRSLLVENGGGRASAVPGPSVRDKEALTCPGKALGLWAAPLAAHKAIPSARWPTEMQQRCSNKSSSSSTTGAPEPAIRRPCGAVEAGVLGQGTVHLPPLAAFDRSRFWGSGPRLHLRATRPAPASTNSGVSQWGLASQLHVRALSWVAPWAYLGFTLVRFAHSGGPPVAWKQKSGDIKDSYIAAIDRSPIEISRRNDLPEPNAISIHRIRTIANHHLHLLG